MLHNFMLLSVVVFATAALGGLLPLFVKNATEEKLKIFVSFGAGVLLGMAFLHMLPEASHLVEGSFGLWFLIGFVILLILERFVMVHACEEHGCHYHTVGIAAFAGLTIHGLIEGFALTSSVLHSEIGLLVLLGIVAHKVPAGVALTTLLQLSGKSKKQVVYFTLGVALSVPVGCLIAYSILQRSSFHDAAGRLLAMSAGTFVYIGACDLLPELHKEDNEKLKRLLAFLFGLALCYLGGFLVPHQHTH